MEYVRIGDRDWSVLVTEISENFNILYGDGTGRTVGVGAEMSLNPLGTFYGYKITFARKRGYEKQYDELFDYISKPRTDGIKFNIVHNQALWNEPFYGYISSGERTLKRIDEKTNKVYWAELSVNIIPMKAQVIPV